MNFRLLFPWRRRSQCNIDNRTTIMHSKEHRLAVFTLLLSVIVVVAQQADTHPTSPLVSPGIQGQGVENTPTEHVVVVFLGGGPVDPANYEHDILTLKAALSGINGIRVVVFRPTKVAVDFPKGWERNDIPDVLEYGDDDFAAHEKFFRNELSGPGQRQFHVFAVSYGWQAFDRIRGRFGEMGMKDGQCDLYASQITTRKPFTVLTAMKTPLLHSAASDISLDGGPKLGYVVHEMPPDPRVAAIFGAGKLICNSCTEGVAYVTPGEAAKFSVPILKVSEAKPFLPSLAKALTSEQVQLSQPYDAVAATIKPQLSPLTRSLLDTWAKTKSRELPAVLENFLVRDLNNILGSTEPFIENALLPKPTQAELSGLYELDNHNPRRYNRRVLEVLFQGTPTAKWHEEWTRVQSDPKWVRIEDSSEKHGFWVERFIESIPDLVRAALPASAYEKPRTKDERIKSFLNAKAATTTAFAAQVHEGDSPLRSKSRKAYVAVCTAEPVVAASRQIQHSPQQDRWRTIEEVSWDAPVHVLDASRLDPAQIQAEVAKKFKELGMPEERTVVVGGEKDSRRTTDVMKALQENGYKVELLDTTLLSFDDSVKAVAQKAHDIGAVMGVVLEKQGGSSATQPGKGSSRSVANNIGASTGGGGPTRGSDPDGVGGVSLGTRMQLMTNFSAPFDAGILADRGTNQTIRSKVNIPLPDDPPSPTSPSKDK